MERQKADNSAKQNSSLTRTVRRSVKKEMIEIRRKRLGANLIICVKTKRVTRFHTDLEAYALVALEKTYIVDELETTTIINPKDDSVTYCFGTATANGEKLHFNSQSYIDSDGMETILLLYSNKTAERNRKLSLYLFEQLNDEDPIVATLKRCETEIEFIPDNEVEEYINSELKKATMQTN